MCGSFHASTAYVNKSAVLLLRILKKSTSPRTRHSTLRRVPYNLTDGVPFFGGHTGIESFSKKSSKRSLFRRASAILTSRDPTFNTAAFYCSSYQFTTHPFSACRFNPEKPAPGRENDFRWSHQHLLSVALHDISCPYREDLIHLSGRELGTQGQRRVTGHLAYNHQRRSLRQES